MPVVHLRRTVFWTGSSTLPRLHHTAQTPATAGLMGKPGSKLTAKLIPPYCKIHPDTSFRDVSQSSPALAHVKAVAETAGWPDPTHRLSPDTCRWRLEL
jgi:hypothetical protein